MDPRIQPELKHVDMANVFTNLEIFRCWTVNQFVLHGNNLRTTDDQHVDKAPNVKSHSHRALALPLRCASVLSPVSSMGKSNGFVHTQH